MEKTASTFEWKTSLIKTYEAFIQNLIEIAPEILGALGLLFLGWVTAHLVRLITHKAMGGLDVILYKFTRVSEQRKGIPQKSYAGIVSKIMFWCVLLFFVSSAANLLEWNIFSGWIDSLVHHLPKLIMGLFIILTGFIVGGVVHGTVLKVATRARLTNGEILALIAQATVVLTTVIVGVEQMGIHVGFLTTIISVVIGILLAGACLAFGLGAQSLVANIIGAQFVRKHCRIGEILRIAGEEGEILEVTQTCIVLETKNGRCIIPAKLFQNKISTSLVASGGSRTMFGGIFNKDGDKPDES